jgi:glycosyltransferase involved in cell wall biosynthesis
MKNKAIKTLIFLPFLTRGGAETQGLLLAKGLKQKGYDVEVCGFELPDKPYTLISELDAVCIKHFVLPFQMNVFGTRLSQLKTSLAFINILNKGKYDVLIPFTWFPNFLSALTFRFGRVKVCFWNQRNVEDHVGVFALEKFIPLNRLKFVSNSTPGRKFLQRRFNLNETDVMLIKNGLSVRAPLKKISSWNAELNLQGRIVITMVANFFHEKDFETVLKAVALLKEKFPAVLLLLAGGGGSLSHKHTTKALAFDLGLTEHLKFLDTVSDIGGLLSVTHIGLLSSISEGCPNSILEYMHAKLPIVASNIEGVADILGNNYEYLFEVGNHQMLSDKMLELMQDENLRKAIGEKLYEKVTAEYEVELMVNSFIQLMGHAR